MAEMNNRLTYSISEVADMFGVHPNTVRKWVREGKLLGGKTSEKKHGRVLIIAESVEMLLESMKKGGVDL